MSVLHLMYYRFKRTSMTNLNFSRLQVGSQVYNDQDELLTVVENYGETFVFNNGQSVNDERLTNNWRHLV